jgi:transposase
MSKKINPFETMSRENLLAFIQYQGEEIELLKRQNAELEARLEKLERQLAKNSSNSSKPPSSDGLKKAKPKSRREKGKRLTGGQHGHEGKTLKMVTVSDKFIVHALEICSQCQADLSRVAAVSVVKRQVFDMPPMRLEVTEHQAEVKVCPCCEQRNRAAFPEDVKAPVQYGANILAHAVYLNSYHLIPLARVREWFADCLGQALSEATIEKALAQFATAVAPSLDRIYEGLTRSQTVHFDETGFRIANQLAYLHTACTDWLSYYIVHCKRGDEAMLDMGVLPKSHGWAVHDGLKAYFGFETVRHALCNAHHLRELEFAFEQYEATWAKSMQSLLLEMKEQVEKQSLSATVLSQLERRYEQLLKEGFEAFPIQDRPPKHQGQFAQHPVTNLLIRLRDYRAAVLAFLYHPEVPFDNNLAERDLRMMKVQQKISGCFRTWAGAEVFAALRTYLATARKQGLSMLKAAYLAFIGSPFIPAIPE